MLPTWLNGRTDIATLAGFAAAGGGLTLLFHRFDWPYAGWFLVATVVALTLTIVSIYSAWSGHRSEQRHKEISLSELSEQLSARDISRRNKSLSPQKPKFVFGNILNSRNPGRQGPPIMSDGPEAVDILGGPGSGKTADVLIPAIFRHAGPALVSTSKTDMAAATIAARLHDGPCYVFDPSGAAAAHSDKHIRDNVVRWTPLSEAVTYKRAQAVARAINRGVTGDNSPESSGSGQFFDQHIVNLVAIVMVYLHSQPGTTLEALTTEIERLDPPPTGDESTDKAAVAQAWSDLRSRIEDAYTLNDAAGKMGDADAARTAQALRKALKKIGTTQSAAMAPNTRAGIMGSAVAIMDAILEESASATLDTAWDDPGALSLDEATLSSVHTLYLVCADEDARPMTNALLEAYISGLNRLKDQTSGTLTMRYLVVLDEIVACTPHPNIPNKWLGDLARSANIKFLVATQSWSDLQKAYGQYGARTLHQNCSGGHLALSRISDEETAKLFTAQAGKLEIWRETSRTESVSKSKGKSDTHIPFDSNHNSNSGKSVTVNKQLVERDVATFATLSQMPVHTGLVVLLGEDQIRGGAVQIALPPWFRDADMQAASHGDKSALETVRARANQAIRK